MYRTLSMNALYLTLLITQSPKKIKNLRYSLQKNASHLVDEILFNFHCLLAHSFFSRCFPHLQTWSQIFFIRLSMCIYIYLPFICSFMCLFIYHCIYLFVYLIIHSSIYLIIWYILSSAIIERDFNCLLTHSKPYERVTMVALGRTFASVYRTSLNNECASPSEDADLRKKIGVLFQVPPELRSLSLNLLLRGNALCGLRCAQANDLIQIRVAPPSRTRFRYLESPFPLRVRHSTEWNRYVCVTELIYGASPDWRRQVVVSATAWGATGRPPPVMWKEGMP